MDLGAIRNMQKSIDDIGLGNPDKRRIKKLQARCTEMEAVLTTLIDDIYATHAIDEGNGDYGPYLDLAEEHADEAKALLAEVQDGT